MTPQETIPASACRAPERDGNGQALSLPSRPSGGLRLGAVILSRMESQRLPGKALADLDGLPLLSHVIHRCRRAACLAGRIVVATTQRPADDALQHLCARERIPVFRGSTDNVAQRLLEAAQAHHFDAFFRVNGDSPLLEPELLDEAASILRHRHRDCDLVTNLHPRSFPYGVSVELLRTTSYDRALANFDQPAHFEHVTPYLYRPGSDCRLVNIRHPGPDLSPVRLTIDTPEDLVFLREFFSHARRHEIPVNYRAAADFSRRHDPCPLP